MDNQVPNTDVGLPEKPGCIIDDKFYPEGRQVISENSINLIKKILTN